MTIKKRKKMSVTVKHWDLIEPLKHEVHLNILISGSFLKENTMLPITKISCLMLCKEIMAVHSENHTHTHK